MVIIFVSMHSWHLLGVQQTWRRNVAQEPNPVAVALKAATLGEELMAERHHARWGSGPGWWRADMAELLASHGTSWHTMAYHGIPWHFMAICFGYVLYNCITYYVHLFDDALFYITHGQHGVSIPSFVRQQDGMPWFGMNSLVQIMV